jgi:hypothetical protein
MLSLFTVPLGLAVFSLKGSHIWNHWIHNPEKSLYFKISCLVTLDPSTRSTLLYNVTYPRFRGSGCGHLWGEPLFHLVWTATHSKINILHHSPVSAHVQQRAGASSTQQFSLILFYFMT